MVNKPECAVVIGLGQLGRVFSAALLANGIAVIPVLRDSDMHALARIFSEPVLVLVATGEADLHTVLENVPQPWRERLCLLQNELLPRDWQQHGISNPTVIPVWFEKKTGSGLKPLLPTPVYGPASELLIASMAQVGIPARPLDSAEQLTFELVLKNLYILTINIAGLRVGGDFTSLWNQHREFAEAVFDEVLAIQEALTGGRFNRSALLAGMDAAIGGDPQHQCTGRSAPVRLARALEHADALGLATPLLRDLARLLG